MCVMGLKGRMRFHLLSHSVQEIHMDRPSSEMQQHQPGYISGEMDLKAILKFKIWK